MIITIDGVAASGKSSVSKSIASSLNIPYISSGLLYRAVTFLAIEADIQLSNEPQILTYLHTHPVRLEPLTTQNKVWQQKRELNDLHSSIIDQSVSTVAVMPDIRLWVNTQLRTLTAPFVAEGRDMGTVVFPQAQHKFYLTASAKVRAERRSSERPENISIVEAALIERDKKDARNITPATDAVIIDTSQMTLTEVISLVMNKIQTNTTK